MTIRHQAETERDKALELLCCDAEGCDREQSFEAGVGWTEELIRVQAAVYGWASLIDGSDCCPFCEPENELVRVIPPANRFERTLVRVLTSQQGKKQ